MLFQNFNRSRKNVSVDNRYLCKHEQEHPPRHHTKTTQQNHRFESIATTACKIPVSLKFVLNATHSLNITNVYNM